MLIIAIANDIRVAISANDSKYLHASATSSLQDRSIPLLSSTWLAKVRKPSKEQSEKLIK